MATIVSGFISNSNTYRSVDKYYELGINLLKINVPKIIFVDELMYEKINSYANEHTKIILYDKTGSYLYPYVNAQYLTNYKTNSATPTKDTLEYMFTVCNKTEWLKSAIELNYFNTSQFVWVDFGLRHVMSSDDMFITSILDAHNKEYSKVRIAAIWNVNNIYNVNIYTNIAWYFAGGVFGGNKDKLLMFAEKMKTHCLQIVTEMKTIMWEVNIWYLIFKENQELFDCYQCDHNDSIINCY